MEKRKIGRKALVVLKFFIKALFFVWYAFMSVVMAFLSGMFEAFKPEKKKKKKKGLSYIDDRWCDRASWF